MGAPDPSPIRFAVTVRPRTLLVPSIARQSELRPEPQAPGLCAANNNHNNNNNANTGILLLLLIDYNSLLLISLLLILSLLSSFVFAPPRCVKEACQIKQKLQPYFAVANILCPALQLLYMSLSLSLYIHIYIYIYIYVYVSLSLYIYIYVCVHIYVSP